MKSTGEDVVQPGEEVGGYRVEKKLGAGGFGQVYLAWRDGSPCALKFLNLEQVGDWGWRELLILMSHDLPHVVKLRGHFKWPEDTPESLVLVMEYVPGVTLFQWARGHNPSAREVVEMLLPLARALGGVHAAGVLHRDLKGNNVLVREPDGQPVLVDFGAGALPNAPPVTRGGMAPGNLRYRSPESIAFLLRRVRERGERYTYGVKDEMYALGVILYVLTTDVYPFDGDDEDLLGEILAGESVPPCDVDARVPGPLSELCMRLLAREPSARVPDAGALCAELEGLLRRARGDPRWEVALCYGWTEQERTTELAPELGGDSVEARLRRWVRQLPRRGPRPAPVVRPSSPAPSTAPGGSTGHPWRGRLALLLGVVVGLAGVGVGLSQRAGSRLASASARWAVASERPADAFLTSPTPWAVSVHEVAPPRKPLEAGPGAAPARADTPAPVTPVTIRTDATRMKKKAPGSRVLLAAVAAANVACPGVQVRKAPGPQACPAGAVETMTGTLGIEERERHSGVLILGAPRDADVTLEPVPVREGPIALVLETHWDVGGEWNPRKMTFINRRIALPHGTRLTGQLYIGEKRVYGRITQAITPAGDTYTVCMDFTDDYGDPLDIKSVERDGVVKIRARVGVKRVEHFE